MLVCQKAMPGSARRTREQRRTPLRWHSAAMEMGMEEADFTRLYPILDDLGAAAEKDD